jgi:NAD(P)-dependent dehydrogenase (short-subunit alcohol dehydrogenase family)
MEINLTGKTCLFTGGNIGNGRGIALALARCGADVALTYFSHQAVGEQTNEEIKTHQCVTLRGQAPTTFRSKLPDLVKQEIYALAITYNLVRTLRGNTWENYCADLR